MNRALLLTLLAGCVALPPTRWTAEPSNRLDDRFLPPGSAWRGGDAIISVSLSAHRVLWLFGDTFIAAPGVQGRAGSRMVRNSLAIENVGGDLVHFWRTENAQPADALKCPVDGHFLWPLSGLRVGPKLHLFLLEMQNKGEGAFGFAVVRNLLATIANPDDPPDHWTPTYLEIPFKVEVGTASLLEGGFAYIYANRPQGHETIVARVAAATLADFTQWRFWTGAEWARDAGSAAKIYPAEATESSVSRLGPDGPFVQVSSAAFLSPDIHLRTALRPEGPWSAASTIFTCPETKWKKGYFCYAGKAHPELDPSGRTLTISYACNAMSFTDAVNDFRIYRPRFVVLTPE